MKRAPLLIVVLIALTGCAADSADVARDLEWAIAIHGGAGTIPKSDPEEISRGYQESLRQALEIGRSVLREGGTALDAVEKVVIFMEDDPHFNAGKGAVYNRDGGHELDASIMDGQTLACGAVAGVTTVKNPIILARRVMNETRHVLLMGEGAERFAGLMGVARVEPKYFDTERRREQWRRHLEESAGGDRAALVQADDATPPVIAARSAPSPSIATATSLPQHRPAVSPARCSAGSATPRSSGPATTPATPAPPSPAPAPARSSSATTWRIACRPSWNTGGCPFRKPPRKWYTAS